SHRPHPRLADSVGDLVVVVLPGVAFGLRPQAEQRVLHRQHREGGELLVVDVHDRPARLPGDTQLVRRPVLLLDRIIATAGHRHDPLAFLPGDDANKAVGRADPHGEIVAVVLEPKYQAADLDAAGAIVGRDDIDTELATVEVIAAVDHERDGVGI